MPRFKFDISGRHTITQISPTYVEITVDGDIITRDSDWVFLDCIGNAEAALTISENEDWLDLIYEHEPQTLQDDEKLCKFILDSYESHQLLDLIGDRPEKPEFEDIEAFARTLSGKLTNQQAADLAVLFAEMVTE